MIWSRLILCLILSLGKVSADYLREDESHKKKKAVLSKEKGFKCNGGGDWSGWEESCEGGMKMEFAATIKPQELVWNLVDEIHSHMQDNFVPDMAILMPSDTVMEDIVGLDVIGDEELQAGMSKTVEFGGISKLEWGCKVNYGWKSGKLFKTAECGFKAGHGEGKKPEDDKKTPIDESSM